MLQLLGVFVFISIFYNTWVEQELHDNAAAQYHFYSFFSSWFLYFYFIFHDVSIHVSWDILILMYKKIKKPSSFLTVNMSYKKFNIIKNFWLVASSPDC